MKNGKTIILGIETSCDETAAAVTADGREVLSNIIASQIDVHAVFGGVVPEIAARHHLTAIGGIVDEALRKAGVSTKEVDAIAVTKGPGLVGAVLIGLAAAKAMAYAMGLPLVGVHHIKGHICAALLEHPELEPPFLALVVSGGHTSLIEVSGLGGADGDMKVLGRTRDDAAGEAYDKVARVLGLGYPGGPLVDKLAKEGDPNAVRFKRTMLEDGSLDFSFSGLKTAVINYTHTLKQAGTPFRSADVAASFQQAVIDVLAEKTRQSLVLTGYTRLVLAGGVASNSALRQRLREMSEGMGVKLFIPSPVFCTDNAAMIACAGYYEYMAGRRDALDLDACATLPLV
ncbi:MAG: tRNA (adenosine(37)-N6)-threonylcarbamoyltransferase complex transferase subunit TsaD [Clostridiales Family XIII bacterium]|jgi:N6-L-threonylcarbamoyladenine synthase|nr:tRNA (adenosine(37)-N6)-threonylcarbamoyltransferase complex transferase subunit TsaD [Clostridiales Family XIII bacterium]